MPLSVLQPYNIPRMPSRPQRPLPPQEEPGPWDKFAESAGQGLGQSIQQQIANKLESSALERAISGDFSQKSALEQYLAVKRSGVSPDTEKNVMGITKEHRGYGHELEKQQAINAGKESPEQKLARSKAIKDYEYEIAQKKKQPTPHDKQEMTNIFNELKNVAQGGNVGFKSKIAKGTEPYYKAFSPGYQKDAAKIKVLNTKLFNFVRKLEQTGHLTEGTFKQVADTLIQPTDTQAEIEGKLQGFVTLLGIDPDVLGPEFAAQAQQGNQNFQIGQIIDPSSTQTPEGTTGVDETSGQNVIFQNGQWVPQ